MTEFKRGLSDSFVSALKEEYNCGGWWKKIVDDEELFVAVRNEYINVYYQGNSLVKLHYSNGKISAKTHYKYLVKPNLEKNENCLIETSGDMNFIPDDSGGFFDNYLTHSLSDIESIKKASAAYGGVEKEGIQKILKSNPNIIDLEIALTENTEQDENDTDSNERDKAKRIDFAAVQEINGIYELLFFEAKDYTNSGLRGAKPAVIEKQIPVYEKLIYQYQKNIKKSYATVCQNLVTLSPKNTFHKGVLDIANGSEFIINPKPRLVIFGFDDDQKNGRYFKKRIGKLTDALDTEEKRVLTKGDPSGFKTGISSPK